MTSMDETDQVLQRLAGLEARGDDGPTGALRKLRQEEADDDEFMDQVSCISLQKHHSNLGGFLWQGTVSF